MKMKKWILPLLALFVAFSLAACNKDKQETEAPEPEIDHEAIEEMNKKLLEQEVEEDLVVAVVNDQELLGERYNIVLQNVQSQFQQMGQDPTTDAMAEQIKTITLDELINQTLLLQEAKSGDIDVSEDEIESEYQVMVGQFGDEETLLAALEAEKIELDVFKSQIADSLFFSKYQDQIIPTVEVSDEEVEEYYKQLKEDTTGEDELPALEDLSEMIRQFIAQEEEQKVLMAHVEKLREKADIELNI